MTNISYFVIRVWEKVDKAYRSCTSAKRVLYLNAYDNVAACGFISGSTSAYVFLDSYHSALMRKRGFMRSFPDEAWTKWYCTGGFGKVLLHWYGFWTFVLTQCFCQKDWHCFHWPLMEFGIVWSLEFEIWVTAVLHEAIDMSIDDILCLSTDVRSIRWPIDPIDPCLWGAVGPSMNIQCIDLNNCKSRLDRVGACNSTSSLSLWWLQFYLNRYIVHHITYCTIHMKSMDIYGTAK